VRAAAALAAAAPAAGAPAPVRRRAFVVVLDACGVGVLPDAADPGDAGADTLGHVAAASGGLDLPVLGRLGLGCVHPLDGVPATDSPVLHGRLAPRGPGKDSTTGHWELMGVVASEPLPTYPGGFPPEIVERLSAATGRGILCNTTANGVEAILGWGEQHLRTGDLIVYTSVDSVLQIAAHGDVVAVEELYEACATVRAQMTGEHAVGRVIARPFQGPPGGFTRTLGRRDYSVPPPGRSYLEELRAAGTAVHAVGKVDQLFAGVGIDAAHAGPTNAIAVAATDRLLDSLDAGLAFVNLVETDQVYGHRKDVPGFERALVAIDAAVGRWLEGLRPDDLLVLTADHGCDPTTPGTDHTREHVPLLAAFDGHGGRRHDGALSDVGASALEWLTGRSAPDLPGESFL
ncbi:MAG TPA: phosphopentomutase, partial [Solirubrobacteraceae bacterium]|nr:phosphopentomutase [Solirubrobacteraceae bacterium]